jgi:hypothetical protein
MHKPMPAYRASRDLWYVEIDGRQIPLGKHPEGLSEPKKSKTKGGAAASGTRRRRSSAPTTGS